MNNKPVLIVKKGISKKQREHIEKQKRMFKLEPKQIRDEATLSRMDRYYEERR